ncbi:TlpA family protein disulfide reductase [Neolewinella sp.]|uniref:TlpA family protein disulfide reductase n=1 Tax=Neolewinella sp. TaxID=2993543 RepID=UPI003B53004B
MTDVKLLKVMFVLCYAIGWHLNLVVAQDPVFNGVVTLDIYDLPYTQLVDIDANNDIEIELQPYRTDITMTFHVCGDSIVYEKRSAKNSEIYRSYQYKNVSFIPRTSGDDGFLEVPGMRSIFAGVEGKHWKPYRKKRDENPLRFSHRLIHPFMNDMVWYARLDESEVYRRQRRNGGMFESAFNPRGKYLFEASTLDTSYEIKKYTYVSVENYSCEQLFEKMIIGKRLDSLTSADQQQVGYSPDTSISLNRDLGQLEIGEVYDTSGAIIPAMVLPDAPYTLVEFYTDNCTGCMKKLPYLDSLRSRLPPSQLGIVSIHVSGEDNFGAWRKLLDKRPERWLNYMTLAEDEAYLQTAFNFRIMPRYVLVDIDGYVVLPYAPWPSDNRLLDVLEKIYPELKH